MNPRQPGGVQVVLLPDPWFNPELSLLDVWSFTFTSCLGGFPPTAQNMLVGHLVIRFKLTLASV